jgi:hypothetical protein
MSGRHASDLDHGNIVRDVRTFAVSMTEGEDEFVKRSRGPQADDEEDGLVLALLKTSY